MFFVRFERFKQSVLVSMSTLRSKNKVRCKECKRNQSNRTSRLRASRKKVLNSEYETCDEDVKEFLQELLSVMNTLEQIVEMEDSFSVRETVCWPSLNMISILKYKNYHTSP